MGRKRARSEGKDHSSQDGKKPPGLEVLNAPIELPNKVNRCKKRKSQQLGTDELGKGGGCRITGDNNTILEGGKDIKWCNKGVKKISKHCKEPTTGDRLEYVVVNEEVACGQLTAPRRKKIKKRARNDTKAVSDVEVCVSRNPEFQESSNMERGKQVATADILPGVNGSDDRTGPDSGQRKKCTAKAGEYLHQRDSNKGNNSHETDISEALDGHEQQGPMEGVMHKGEMLLVDSRRRVFSGVRDDKGDLVQVGIFEEGGVVMHQEPFASDGVTRPCDSNLHDGRVRCLSDLEDSLKGRGKEVPLVTKRSKKKKSRKKNKKDKKPGVVDVSSESGRDTTKEGDKSTGSTGTTGVKEGCLGGNKGECNGQGRSEEVSTVPEVVEYPFEVEDVDHCETSERAYADVAPILKGLAASLGKLPKDLVIYDPYYCQGSVVGRLSALGFHQVINRKEDFYKVLEEGRVPDHDVVLTNPPYSGDHIPRHEAQIAIALHSSKTVSAVFCTVNGTAVRSPTAGSSWPVPNDQCLTMQEYYHSSLREVGGVRAVQPFYLTPPKRYDYHSPRGSRLNVKSSERKTSPFNTFWYIHLGSTSVTSRVLQGYDKFLDQVSPAGRCCVARSTQLIPFKMMDSNDPRRKKARDRQRSIERLKKKRMDGQ